MLLGLVGFAVALVGACLFFTEFPRAGHWVVVVGVFTGLAGAVLHWVKNWRDIFGVRDD
jgi:hypothetical protein